MLIMNASFRLLKPLSRQTNLLKRYNKTILRTLSCYTKTFSVHQVPSFEQKRRYSDWNPNIVKSPYRDVPIPETLLTNFFWEKAEKWSDLTALVCGITGREMKYKELRMLCKRLATSLLKEGFKPGDVVAMILPNMPEFPVIALGLLEAGIVVTTINPLYTADEIVYQIKNSQAVGIFTIPEKLDTVLEAKAILEQENPSNPSKLRIICTNHVLGDEPQIPKGVDRLSRLIDDNVDVSILPSLQGRGQTTNDVAVIPYSSGTTGRPKGVCLTHRNLISSIICMHVLRDVEEATRSNQEVIPAILPSFHIFGFSVVMLQSLYCGAKVVTLPKFDENSFLNVMKKYKCTVLYVAPPLVLYLGSSPNVTEEHLRSVKIILSGAAPVAESDIMKCVKKSPPTVFYKQGYGLTETSPGICAMEKGIKKYNSVGIVAVNTLVKVADLQTNQALGPNEEGEICVKGPQVMKGYLNNEKATANVFDSEGWFHTGDIGYYDNDKHFYITDRLKELIKVKGFQVAPAELEALLRSHPDVDDAGVIGIPDPRKGESPIGFVKRKKNSKVTEDELKAFLAPKIATFKQIDNIVFVESIPKSASGKILRKDLKENYLKKIDLEGFLETKKPKDNCPNNPNERN
ncbi:uncharacterized protein [Halyomorpha halys]|uniref:uncharacterized protein n=1 Tax=Halyomorpha halys TaxID=286706 RepID=UPI0006D4DC4A|nr:4-coumarate--CoA ligase 1-like [Halyomorpha halys]